MPAPLPSIAYAKNPAHEQFVQQFAGRVRGRYVLAFLVGVGYLGGSELRESIEAELGNPEYPLNELAASVRDIVVIFDRVVRAGVSSERMGEIVFGTYKRANPRLLEGITVHEGFEVLEKGYREDTTYGGVSPASEVGPSSVRLFRTNSPLPCDAFLGVVKGLLKNFGLRGTVEEVTCQWEGAPRCTVEARWEK